GTAASNAGILKTTQYTLDKASGLFQQVITPVNKNCLIVFLITLGVAVFGNVLFKKFLAVIPILVAIIAGYISAVLFHVVDMQTIQDALSTPLFTIPAFQWPHFKVEAILILLPVILVIASEHIGHQVVTSKIVGRDLPKDPGLHRSLFADNFSTMLSGLVGSVPTTTYGENIGVMAMTKVYSVRVIGGAAVDYGKSRNLTLTSIVFVTGLSGAAVNLGNVELKGMVLACIVGMILSLLFYIFDRLKLTNDRDD
ncbi:MAG: solute carrier family 23 protein, partial [Lachnospiraceae bacterium]